MLTLGILLMIPLYGLAFYAFGWVILRLIAAMGWSRLAALYPATGEPSADAYRLRWNTLNVGSRFFGPAYRGCINAWFERGGLYLKPSLFFSAGHPPLFLPWTAMQTVAEEGSWVPRTCVQLAGDVPPIFFYGSLGTAVADSWRDRNPVKGTT